MNKFKKYSVHITFFSLFVTISIVIGSIVIILHIKKDVTTLKSDIQQKEVLISDYRDVITKQKKQIKGSQDFIRSLRKQIDSSTYNLSYIKGLIENASDTITDIKKLEEADKQLLAKYSKIFFLNEHYKPKDLVFIPQQSLSADKKIQIKSDVLPFLSDMLTAMEKDGLQPRIISAYRSFGYQAGLKRRDVLTFGEGTANKFVADQGYSEHQLGTTVDIGTAIPNKDFSRFKTTKEYAWLLKNAYKYGFILSYPKGNSYYAFESWHWRFVGVALATELNKKKEYFYDMPQRKINTYRLKMFDK